MLKRVIYPILQPFAKWYFSKPRNYRYKDLKVLVKPGVFFPHLTISTKRLLQYLDREDINGKAVLELGAGCGIISLRCVQNGARVTASDISPLAIENIKTNQERVGVDLNVQQSDLFDSLPGRFDLVIINPPYYPKDPKTDPEKAWFCGAEFQYFKKLATQLKEHLTQEGHALMILSEDCDINQIRQILESEKLKMSEISRKKRFGEQNFLFLIA